MDGIKEFNTFKSVAIWPVWSGVTNVYGENKSEDTHTSLAQALAVCELLEKEGLGGEKMIFPTATYVEKIKNNEVVSVTEVLRPKDEFKWDRRFLAKAQLVASWSKDPDHKVGAIITRDNKTLSEGFNGPPAGVRDTRLDRKTEVLRTLHAELNAILFAGCPLKGATIYVYPFIPCAVCAAAIIQTGISKVVYHEDSCLPTWQASQREAIQMFKEAGVQVIKLKNF